MAENYVETPIEEGDRIEFQINWAINRQIELLNQRRGELVAEVRQKQGGRRFAENARREKVRQLIEAQEQLQATIKDNSLEVLKGKILSEMEDKIRVLRESIIEEEHIDWECDSSGLQECIANLGEVVVKKGLKPNYGAFQSHIVATWKEDSNFLPFGVAIDEKTNQIFVAEHTKTRIQVFSDRGQCLNHIGEEYLKSPWGVTIYHTNLFVCDWGHHALFVFSLLDFKLVKQLGKFGSENGEFKWPRQLTVYNNSVFVADCFNHRVSVFDTDLIHQRNITHESMPFPTDVKLSRDIMYVLILTESNGLCVQVFTIEGEYVNSIITLGKSCDVVCPWFFCLDTQNNFVISDVGAHNVKVFSGTGTGTGTLLHTIGQDMLHESKGIAITLSGKLVCVSNAKNATLQIFY